MATKTDEQMAANGVPFAIQPLAKSTFLGSLTSPGYKSGDAIQAPAPKPVKIDPTLPEWVKNMIQSTYDAGEEIEDGSQLVKPGDEAAAGQKDGTIIGSVLDRGKNILSSMGAGALGGAFGFPGVAASAAAGKLGEGWTRVIIIVMGAITLGVGLILLGTTAANKAADAAGVNPGKMALKLLPAGKAASVVKGIVK